MALPDTLLNPIPGENPSGQSLRWDPVYGKIKEARREEAELPQGEWAREVKLADPAVVIKLATEALSKKTKDLQLAAWLTEALLREEGFSGLKEGLDLLRGMVENFWDTVYPEAEDGDVELRVAPLTWVGSYLDELVRKVPLTGQGFTFLKYVESRAISTEEACASSDSKMAARSAAIADGKLTPEEFDKDVIFTSRDFYVELAEEISGALESLEALNALSEEKAGRDSPSFGKLQAAIEEVQSLAKSFLKTKPDTAAEAEVEETTETAESYSESASSGTTVATAPVRRKALTEEPVDAEDAIRRIIAGSAFLRKDKPYSPAAFLVLRGLRWGELRAGGFTPAPELLEAPPSEIRQQLKRLAGEGNWTELLEATEAAMSMPCGRSWLDVQRYSVRACQEMGGDYEAISRAIQSGVKGLIADIPDLLQATFLDDTPIANPETLAWLRDTINPPQTAPEQPQEEPQSPRQAAPVGSESQAPDAQDLALQAARAGKTAEAVEILTREIAQERSGRARFERKTQLASLCLTTKHESIAYPILRELADEIERRKLEEWESPAVLAKPLVLLFKCLSKLGGDGDEKQKVYERICRLDPVQALACLK
jgi:type VI secretion system protein ImpA